MAWWAGDGNANDSAGTNPGILEGGATFAAGRVGQAFQLDGSDDRIRVPHKVALVPSAGFTIEAWIRSNTTAGPRAIVSKWNDNTSDWSYILKDHNFSSAARFELSRNTHNDLADLSSTTLIVTGTWIHLAATYDTNIVRLYYNGVLDGQQTVGPNRFIDASVTDLLIGAVYSGGVAENFSGLIDEVSLYNRALSGAEVTSIVQAGSDGKVKPAAPAVGAPVAVNDSFTTNKDTPLVVGAPGILANDTDPEAGTLAVTPDNPPTHGSLSLAANGSFTYSPTIGYVGQDSFTYRASDGALESNLAIVTITVVGPANTAPAAVNDSFTTNKDTPLSVPAPGILANDTDPDSNPLTATLSNGPAHGAIVLVASGSFIYTPTTGYVGLDSFTYRARDGALESSLATVTITVAGPANAAPAAANDSVTTPQNVPLVVAAPGILANDTDPDSNPLTASLASGPAHGTLNLIPDGSFTYTPAAGYAGHDSFTYKARDAALDSNPATVTITVTAVNRAPTASNVAATTAEDVPGAIVLVASDPDNDPLTYTIVSPPLHGTLSGVAPNLTYTPAANYNGPDSFTYRVSDGPADSQPATAAIVVTPVNDAPSFIIGANLVVAGQDGPQSIAGWATSISTGPPDESWQSLTFVVIVSNSNLFTRQPALDSSGHLTFTPAPNVSGIVTITVTLFDNGNPAAAAEGETPLAGGSPTAGGINHSAAQSAQVNITQPTPAQNDGNPLDTNNDDTVAPIDALLIISYLNHHGSGPVPTSPSPEPPTDGSSGPPDLPPGDPPPQPQPTPPEPVFLDTSGNNVISPLDLALVINYLNMPLDDDGTSGQEPSGGAGSGGEGESREQQAAPPASLPAAAASLNAAPHQQAASTDPCEPPTDLAYLISLLALDTAEQSLRRKRLL